MHRDPLPDLADPHLVGTVAEKSALALRCLRDFGTDSITGDEDDIDRHERASLRKLRDLRGK